MNLFDKYFKKYDAWYNKNEIAYLSELKAIKKVLPRKGKGLEIGVGTGRFAAPLGIKFGVDPSRRAIKIAKERGVNVRVGIGEKLPFKSSYFDYAAIIISICFVQDPLKVISEARRVLKKKGKIVVAIVDKDSFLGRYYQKKKSVFYKEAEFFTVNDVVRMLKENGFVRFSYYQTLFKLPDKMTVIEKPQRGFDRGGFVVINAAKGIKKLLPKH